MTEARRGADGEAQIALRFQSHGCVVSLPLMRAVAYDLIADIADRPYKVQVKFIGSARTRVDVSKKGRKRRVYGPHEIDLMAVYQEGGSCYLFPWPSVAEHTITLTKERKRAFQFEKVLADILAERHALGAARSG